MEKKLRELFRIIENKPSQDNYVYVARETKKLNLKKLNFHKIKIAILSSFTIDLIVPYLEVRCYQEKLNPEIYVGGYNLFQQEILNSKSRLYNFNPDVLILAVRLQELTPKLWNSFLELSKEEINNKINHIIMTIRSLLSTFRKHSQATVILHNFETPTQPNFGILESKTENNLDSTINKINDSIVEICRCMHSVYILNYEHLTALYGKLNWQDEKMWFLAKIPIAGENLLYLANEYLKYLKPLKGLNRKCLVLDLDNTLWGGILGEEGPDGIKIGQTFPGDAFLEFQREVLKLYNRGIILAINSKNNEEEVMRLFERHPDMILKKKHFATMKINWRNKVDNMKEIAQDLNLGLDSFVFIDDDPVERELIKTELPEVSTVDIPKDPSYYAKILRDLPDFEILSFSEEDRKRGEMYQARVVRKRLKEVSTSLEGFYEKLEMEAEISPGNNYSIPRIAQLTQKTNQFNLTTKRYTESEIRGFSQNLSWDIFSLKLKDKFGDSGIVGVAIIKKINGDWYIDTFLLSCRVIGRTVETAMLAFIVDKGKREGIKNIYGRYIPTEKNKLVENFYKDHGFNLLEEDDKGTKWILNTGKSQVRFPEWIEIVC